MSAALIARRSLVALARQPAAWAPGAALPLLMAAIFAANYHSATRLGLFPGHTSYLAFIRPGIALTGALWAGIAAGVAVTDDLASGFQRRLHLTQASLALVLAGPVIAAAVQSLVQAGLFLVIFWLTGAGWPASVTLYFVAPALFAIAIAGLAISIGGATGDNEVMQSTFGVLLIGMLMSSAFFPPGLMRGWFAAAAAHSPLTWLADGIRDAHPVAALATPLLLAAVTLTLALLALRSAAGR
jgi:ABC-2 type transport system permease protein